MKLRYRLFLSVALIFSLTFSLSLYIEARLIKKDLKERRKDVLNKFNEISTERVKIIQSFVETEIYKIQAKVDAIFESISEYEPIRSSFEPNYTDLNKGNWLEAASLMLTNNWVDYIQSNTGEILLSEIIVDNKDLVSTIHFPSGQGFDYVALSDTSNPNEWGEPLIAIPFDIKGKNSGIGNSDDLKKEFYVYFTLKSILSYKLNSNDLQSLELSINLIEPFLKWLSVKNEEFQLSEFVNKFKSAQSYLQADLSTYPSLKQWEQMIAQKLNEASSFPRNLDSNIEATSPKGSVKIENLKLETKTYYENKYTDHYDKIGLIWGLAMLTKTELFGKSPFSESFPVGIGSITKGEEYGLGLNKNTVFYDKKMYPGKQVLADEKLEGALLKSKIDVIDPIDLNDIYLGKTASYSKTINGEKTSSSLTIGTSAEPILEELSRSTSQVSMLITNKKVISIHNRQGNFEKNSEWDNVPISELLSKKFGDVSVGKERFFFLHIIPKESPQLHFFIFNKQEKAYSFVNMIGKGAKDLINKVSLQMRILSALAILFVLLSLNNISRRITKPITRLAMLTKQVGEGKLEDILIPNKKKKGKYDEIYTLYHSFFEMVEGLKEKEQVRGILNKVVSEEIAEEALKGNIQLGGEEKYVTVFFADIRDFTRLTENMNPKEVIKVVNCCMTKVSNNIDKYNGVLDKYVGDEVMALFGAPIEKKESAIHAIESAIGTVRELRKWNIKRAKEGVEEIEMGIGIHTGNVVAGNMGAENRLNYTVLGANVNLASRICSEAQGMQILISEETYNAKRVKEVFQCNTYKTVSLKGFSNPINIFEVVGYKL